MIVAIPAYQQSILISIAIKMSDARYHKIIVNNCFYDTIANVVNMKFQVYLQIPGGIHFNCHNFSHDINLLFFKIYVLNEIFGGKMFSHSKFCKGNCLLLTSLF